MAFGDNIQKLRNAKGMSQQELADAIGIGRSTLANYEQNKREASYETLKSIAKYFNVSIDYILGLTDNQFDYTHKDTLNEIIYKQLIKLPDIKNQHTHISNKSNLLEDIKNGIYEINEKSIQLIADAFDTNTSYLLGLTSLHYSYDPMETGNILDNENIKKLIQQPEKIIEENYKAKRQEHEHLTINKAFNTLLDLGIEKINGKYIRSIDDKTILKYYYALTSYLKNTIRMIDLDKVISEYNDSNKFNNNNCTNYYHDYYVTHRIKNIDDIKNGYQFENYLAYLLILYGFVVYTNSDKKTFNGPGMIAINGDNRYIIECKYIDVKNINDKNMKILNIPDFSQIIKTSDYQNYKYIFAINIEFTELANHYEWLKRKKIDSEIIIWDREYIINLESYKIKF